MSNQTVVVCQCGQKIRATERLVGKTVRCPKCQQPVKIPADQATASVKKKSPGDKIRAQCEACGTKLAVKPELAGKRVQCPKCKQPVKIPTTNKGEGPPPVKTTPPKSPSSQPPPGKPKKGAKSAAKATGVADLLDEVGVTETLGNCPECRTELEADQRICLSCGFDQDRGKRVNVKKFLDDDSKYNPYAKVKGGTQRQNGRASSESQLDAQDDAVVSHLVHLPSSNDRCRPIHLAADQRRGNSDERFFDYARAWHLRRTCVRLYLRRWSVQTRTTQKSSDVHRHRNPVPAIWLSVRYYHCNLRPHLGDVLRGNRALSVISSPAEVACVNLARPEH